jgi:hypothetical protein
MAIVFIPYLENDRTCAEQATIALQSAGYKVISIIAVIRWIRC